MTEEYPDTHTSLAADPMNERVQHARVLLAEVCLTDPNTVGEPAELAKRLFGVSRAVSDIVHANATKGDKSRIVSVSAEAVQATHTQALLSAMKSSMRSQPTVLESLVAKAENDEVASLSLGECRDQSVRLAWNLRSEVVIPSDRFIINNLYGEPAVLHDTREVYARATVRGKERDLYPFCSSEYQPGVTVAYLGVLQGLCRQLLGITTQKP